MMILLLISLFILNQCVAFRISSSSLSSSSSSSSSSSLLSSNFSYKKKSIVSMNLFNNYNILYQNSLLFSSDDDIKNQLLPYQSAVVIFIFVVFGTLQSKLNTATSIKQEIDKLQYEIKRLNILIINNDEKNKTIISDDIKQKEERIKNLKQEFRKGMYNIFTI